jgi:hypothetical protein
MFLFFFIHHFPLVFSKSDSSVNDDFVFSKIEHYSSRSVYLKSCYPRAHDGADVDQ